MLLYRFFTLCSQVITRQIRKQTTIYLFLFLMIILEQLSVKTFAVERIPRQFLEIFVLLYKKLTLGPSKFQGSEHLQAEHSLTHARDS
jgi:hypothetical protein